MILPCLKAPFLKYRRVLVFVQEIRSHGVIVMEDPPLQLPRSLSHPSWMLKKVLPNYQQKMPFFVIRIISYLLNYTTIMTYGNTSLKNMTNELKYWVILRTVPLSLIFSHTSRGISKENPMILYFLLQFSWRITRYVINM